MRGWDALTASQKEEARTGDPVARFREFSAAKDREAARVTARQEAAAAKKRAREEAAWAKEANEMLDEVERQRAEGGGDGGAGGGREGGSVAPKKKLRKA